MAGNRNLLPNLNGDIDFKKLFSEQFGEQLGATTSKNGFVSVKSRHVLIVGRPAHPFRFRRQVPFIGIKIGNQSRFNFSFANVSTIVRIRKLRGISDLSPPCLAAAEACRAGGHPNDRTASVHDRAHEIPLMATKMTRSWHEEDRLIQTTDLDS
jgi:hypothetical protein